MANKLVELFYVILPGGFLVLTEIAIFGDQLFKNVVVKLVTSQSNQTLLLIVFITVSACID